MQGKNSYSKVYSTSEVEYTSAFFIKSRFESIEQFRNFSEQLMEEAKKDYWF